MNKNFLKNKTILVTGGTGSFGKKFSEIVLQEFKLKKLIIYSRDELKQFEMSKKLAKYKDVVRYLIGDIRDLQRLKFALKDVDIVIHAAALKQVPSSEYNPFEVVKTNILGTQNVVDACIENKIDKVISLSTDKACSPTNLYGASKLTADKLVVAANNYANHKISKFSVVRYGNVMMSRGSVIPEFFEQKKSGKINITDVNMTRFSITLKEGVNFVLESLERMWGGELFIPKIPSYKLTDLAKAIAPQCKINIIGIRPGEKIHEEMITKSDALNTIEFKNYFVIMPSHREYIQWDIGKFISKSDKLYGKICKENFSYNSKNNNFLPIKELKSMIKEDLDS